MQFVSHNRMRQSVIFTTSRKTKWKNEEWKEQFLRSLLIKYHLQMIFVKFLYVSFVRSRLDKTSRPLSFVRICYYYYMLLLRIPMHESYVHFLLIHSVSLYYRYALVVLRSRLYYFLTVIHDKQVIKYCIYYCHCYSLTCHSSSIPTLIVYMLKKIAFVASLYNIIAEHLEMC